MPGERFKSSTKYQQKVDIEKRLSIDCQECGHKIEGPHININNSLAQCPNCSTVFQLKDRIEVEKVTSKRVKNLKEEAVPNRRPEMIMPEGTDVIELSDSIDIRIDWLKAHPKGALGFLTFFTAIWNGILFFVAMGLLGGAFGNLIFLSGHLLVGLGLIYYLAGVYLNYTDIIVTKDFIEISHRPVKNPFNRTKVFDVKNIKQFYVSKYVSSTTNGQPNYAYALYAILKNGKKQQIIKGMNRETQLYLEQYIEQFLSIEDIPVTGSIVS